METRGESGVIRLGELMTEERLVTFLTAFENSQDNRRPGLSYSNFTSLFSRTMDLPENSQSIQVLCKKIDSSGEGLIERDSFINYLLHQLRDKNAKISSSESVLSTPFFMQNPHSKESPCRMVQALVNPQRLISVTKDGVISTWSTSLELQKVTFINKQASDISQQLKQKKMMVWVTDIAVLSSCNMLVLSTTSRELLFYDVSTSVYTCQYKLRDLPHVPLCMTSHCRGKRSNDPAHLIYGDQAGSISVFLFHHPMTSLFATNSAYQETCPIISYKKLADHSQHVSFTLIQVVHPDWVRRVAYVPHNNCIISCSNSPMHSLVIQELEGKMKPYVFNLTKGVTCFDFNLDIDLLVTGGIDHLVRLWDPHVTSRATAILIGHTSPVIDVIIHRARKLVISFAQNLVVCVWDIIEQSLLQMVTVKFPFSHRQPEFGAGVLCLFSCSSSSSASSSSILAVPCNENIAGYKLGSSAQSNSQLSASTHSSPLTGVLYDHGFNQVVTGCEGGVVKVWDIGTGSKILQLTQCHSEDLLTAMEFDTSGKRLLTGSQSGEIKVWDIITGDCLNQVLVPGHTEVTGLVHIPDRTMFLSVGWNRRITTFPADSDRYVLRCDHSWTGPNHHQDDITCLTYSPPHYLATGSFDGEIIIWNTDIERQLTRYCSMTRIKPSTNLKLFRESSLPTSSRSTLASRSSSRPASRRMSAYYLKSTSVVFQHVPIDKLLFLQSRMRDRSKEDAVLVSSEGGHACFWELLGGNEAKGSFPLTKVEGETVLSLATDSSNQYLVAGDTSGNIAVFDISNYAHANQDEVVPSPLTSWRAHDGEITSLQLVMHTVHQLIVSGGTDCSVRLWNMSGHYIGTFGQANPWNLQNPASFQHPKTPWGQVGSTESPHALQCATFKSGRSSNGKPSSPATNLKTSAAANRAGKETRLAATGSLASSTSSLSHRIDSGTSAANLPAASENTLGEPYKEMAKQRMADKLVRRTTYSEVDHKSVERFGNVCSPFQALMLQEVTEQVLPTSLSAALQHV